MDLERKLGFLDVFCIASGAMICLGLFVLPGLAHSLAGPAVVFSYLLAGLLAASGLLSLAEIVTAMPKAGGDYFIINRTMGPAVGTAAGLLVWFSFTLKSSFALVGLGALLQDWLPWAPGYTAFFATLFVVGLNIVSSKEAIRFESFLVLATYGLMTWFIVAGISKVDLGAMIPFRPHGWEAVFGAAGFVFVTFGGALKIVAVAEEVKDPGVVIPRAMFAAVVVVVLMCTTIVFILAGTLPPQHLNNSLTPILEAANLFMGTTGAGFMALAALFAFITTANAGVMAASRYLFSLSRDKLLPSAFRSLHERWQTPIAAILFTGATMSATYLLDINILVKTASCVMLMTYILGILCLIVLRESHLVCYRPQFQAPLYPYLQVFSLAGFVSLLLGMGKNALLLSFFLTLGGFLFYWFYGRIKEKREFALVFLIGRLLDRDVISDCLESELRNIVRERDDVCHDRFDKLVEKAPILDLPGTYSHHEFFGLLALKANEAYGEPIEIVRDALEHLCIRGSTVLTPGIAVYNVIVPRVGVTELVVARFEHGVQVPGEATPVQAVFLLLVSRDQQNFYLRAVTAIAQIIQNPKFIKRWQAMDRTEGLRHLLLMGERNRDSQNLEVCPWLPPRPTAKPADE